jgi:hypothetical protein
MMFGNQGGYALVRAGWGFALLTMPQRVLAAAGHPHPSLGAQRIARVLGARHLAQAGFLLTLPSRRTVCIGATVDALHCLSGVALATVSPRWRSAAAADALLAATFAILSELQERKHND